MSKIFECFTGEFVTVLLNKDDKNSVNLGNNIKSVQSPMVIGGFLIEEDDEYFFMGYDPDLICIAVKRNQVVVMEIVDQNAEIAHQLDDAVETPLDDTGIN